MARIKKAPLTEMEKLAKKIGDDGQDVLRELEAADTEELNRRVTQSSQAIHDSLAELQANENYKSLSEDLKVLKSGHSGVKKRQGAIIKIALSLRKDRGVA